MMTTKSLQNLALAAVVCCLCFVHSAVSAPYEIPLKSGTILPRAGEFVLPPTPDDGSDVVHVLLQLNDYLRPGDRERLLGAGIELLSYLPDRAYAAALPRDMNIDRLTQLGIRSVTPFYPEFKLHPRVSEARFGDWSLLDSGERIFSVEIMRDVPLEIAVKELQNSGFLTGNLFESAHSLLVACDESKAADIAAFDFVLFLNEASPPLSEVNDVVRTRLHVNEVQDPPYNLSGEGVTILVFDGGMADNTHPDFAGRMTWSENAAVSAHATHTSGTVGGDGSASGGLYRGMAPAVTLISGQYDFCIPYCFYDSPNDIEGDYTNARVTYGIELTTNSMGANINSNQYDCSWFGDYETTEQMLDGMVRNTYDAPLTMFWSAGNERNDNWCGVSTYGCISIPAGAKNIITVGATTSTDANASFSSWGPTDDGRLKPEIVATGVNVTSCAPGGGYATFSGTSMSCPASAGVGCLVLEQWHIMFPGAPDPLPETMKAILINSATDLGSAGPDYQRGFGIVNALQAIDNMIAGGVLESALDVGETFTHTFTVEAGTPSLRLSLAWSDVPAVGNVIPTLVNNLNLSLTDPDDTDHLPWLLDPDSPASPPSTGVDDINICEQVYVNNPVAGEWTLTVSGSVNSGESQTFGISANVALVAQWSAISGQVKDSDTQTGVPGRVSITGSSQTMWTDADGNYALTVPRGATYSLHAEAFGYLPLTESVEANTETVDHDFDLTAAESTTLSGVVTNSLGTPLVAADITFVFPNAAIPAVLTDDDGDYSNTLPGGNHYEVTANYLGVTQIQGIDMPETGSATLDFIIDDPRVSPAGPDDYGYYCYEAADTGLVPVWEYTSILPSQGGSGTTIGPGDGNDWLETITLPFTVTFYGQEYTQVTVSADGWVGFGAASGGAQPWTNVPIPDSGAPNGMICVFWDDLFPYNPTEGGEIGQYHDAANGRFIIEYREVPQFTPLTNHATVQLMIYDNDTRPTVTGDNEFELHFERFDYVGPGPTIDADATIGIESPNGDDGLEIVYDGGYHVNNYALGTGSALRFTTGIFAGEGALGGQITTVPPAADYSIFTVSFGDYEATAESDGSFFVENVAARQYRVTINADGYESYESALLTVNADDTTYVDFEDVYRLDPARNLDGEWIMETNMVELVWNRPAWVEEIALRRSPGGDNLDALTSYQVIEQSRGVLGSVQDTTYSWEPPNIGFYNFWITAQYDGGTAINSDTLRVLVLDADENSSAIPTEFSLAQNYPNPFNPNTTIEFGLPADSDVRLEVFDVLGRTVTVLAEQRYAAGMHSVEFSGNRLGTGLYFYRLTAGDFVQLRKMLLVR